MPKFFIGRTEPRKFLDDLRQWIRRVDRTQPRKKCVSLVSPLATNVASEQKCLCLPQHLDEIVIVAPSSPQCHQETISLNGFDHLQISKMTVYCWLARLCMKQLAIHSGVASHLLEKLVKW